MVQLTQGWKACPNLSGKSTHKGKLCPYCIVIRHPCSLQHPFLQCGAAACCMLFSQHVWPVNGHNPIGTSFHRQGIGVHLEIPLCLKQDSQHERTLYDGWTHLQGSCAFDTTLSEEIDKIFQLQWSLLTQSSSSANVSTERIQRL